MITPHHPSFPYFSEKVEALAGRKRVIDMGTPGSFHKEMSFFRGLFRGNYRSMGYKGNRDLETDLKGDLMSLDLPDRSLDGIICLSVLPSVRDPHRAVGEIYRVLEPGGLFLGTFPFLTGYYAVTGGRDPYPDYWRFTRECLEMLFAGFSRVEVRPIDGWATVRFKFLPPVLNRMTRWAFFNRFLGWLDGRMESAASTGYIVFAEK